MACSGMTTEIQTDGIALFTVSFSHLHYNVMQRVCEAISGENRIIIKINCPKLPDIHIRLYCDKSEKSEP